ncbi:TniB family NTP-binding protein [Streptomyces sp. UNOB3_S3]|uniref:TniB family NTP-binding protein n=1 Tax=Streptomyces sp. UNOB3_S3 TaxID=2871682 RepID=UPI001E35ABD8|nr:TniB family NTP-binding protein [Streptomyces sp. UNOB3_S3]MCC3773621.1 TniB family NTP-binding protein [Streptomyces sp. UNOB3_S3]
MYNSFSHPGLAEPRTKEEWRIYLNNRPPERPRMPSYDAYIKLSVDERDDLNDARADYHSALAIVRTPQMRRIHHLIERRMRMNARQTAGARRGIIVDGPPTVGKSTLVKMYAADYEHKLRRRFPEKFADGYELDGVFVDYTPVVYVSIPAQATPKDLSILFADYLGLPDKSGTKQKITKHVLATMQAVGVELVIIDDVHFLDLSLKEGRVVNDHLKYISNHTAATFVYTGVELKKSGLILEGQTSTRASQTAGRNNLCEVKNFGFRTAEEKREWAEVVVALENTLELYRHKPGQLVKLSPYLHDRTGGSICGLSDLLRESAVEAVMSGEEAITRRLMDTIEISEYAEAAYREVKRRQRTSSGTARPAVAAAG